MKPVKLESSNRILERDALKTVVTSIGDSPWLGDYGSILKNPKANPKSHRWVKEFHDKEVFFPDEHSQAVNKYLNDFNSFVLSMNGYSDINEKKARQYGVSAQAYVEACKSIYRSIITHLKEEFPKVNIKIIDGASDMGVDRACQEIAKETGFQQLGFSCPEYLPYVEDGNGFPVYVAEDKQDYSHKYVQSLDFLVTTGGRAHAYELDTHAVFLYNKQIHIVNVLDVLSTNGNVASKIINEDGSITIDNAAGAIEMALSMYGYQGNRNRTRDEWPLILEDANSVAAKACRNKMAPELMFKQPDNYLKIVNGK